MELNNDCWFSLTSVMIWIFFFIWSLQNRKKAKWEGTSEGSSLEHVDTGNEIRAESASETGKEYIKHSRENTEDKELIVL